MQFDQLKRRAFITLLGGAAAWPLAARAQQPAMPVIGFLHPGFSDVGSPVFDALRNGLRDVGYIEGETVKVEARWARGKPEALPQLTQELIQLNAAILIATARASIEAARAATSTLPILANDLESDPVASGYVASLSHPGGNLTGMFLDAPTLCGKWFAANRRYCPECKKNRSSLGCDDRHVSARCDKGGSNGEVD
jgi:putative tryptophan/tyrosine transport system substrate-binding protein